MENIRKERVIGALQPPVFLGREKFLLHREALHTVGGPEKSGPPTQRRGSEDSKPAPLQTVILQEKTVTGRGQR